MSGTAEIEKITFARKTGQNASDSLSNILRPPPDEPTKISLPLLYVTLSSLENSAWKNLKNVAQNIFGNHKVSNYKDLTGELLSRYLALDFNILKYLSVPLHRRRLVKRIESSFVGRFLVGACKRTTLNQLS